MVRLELKHKAENDKQTLGLLDVYKNGVWLFTLHTLELSWMNNVRNKSRVWEGQYIVEPWNSAAHPNTFILKGTSPRTGILIHIANFFKDLLGCIAVGLSHTDIDGDGYRDVKYSTEAMNMLRVALKDEENILLTIK